MKILDFDQKKSYLRDGKVTLPWWAMEVESMDLYDKLLVYFDYLVSSVTWKHDFRIKDKLADSWNRGSKKNLPCLDKPSLELIYDSADSEILTFEQFCSFDRIHIYDFGENWNNPYKYAQRYSLSADGIYHWWFSFRDNLKHKVSFTRFDGCK